MRLRAAASVALCLVPGALVALAGSRSGGFFAGGTALLALAAAGALVLRLALAPRPVEGLTLPVVLAGASLAAFCVWILLSQRWSHAPARALVEYDRALLYGLVLLLFGSLGRTVWRMRIIVYGVASASVGLCLAGLVTRTLPDLWRATPTVHPERLSFPLTYWNAMGLIAAIGLVLCGHLACSEREPRTARILGAGAVPALATTLFLTYSRGGVLAAILGVAAYMLIARPRVLLTGVVATVPPAIAAVLVADHARALQTPAASAHAIAGQGGDVALAVGLATAAALVLRAVLTAVDPWLARPKLSGRARRRATAGAVGGLVVAAVACGIALDLPKRLSDGYRTFTRENVVQTKGAQRLTSVSNNGRLYHWRVSLHDFHAHPWNGTGAGTYQTEWARQRPTEFTVNDGHSLYLETLGELGVPGLVFVVVALVTVLAGTATRIRGPDRALYGAIFASGLAWAFHAGVDWDWEMPAVTLAFFALGGAAMARTPRTGAPRSPVRWRIACRALTIAACVGLALVPLQLRSSQAALDHAARASDRGDCRAAVPAALDSLAALDSRPEPFEIVALCDGAARRFKLASQMAAAAARRDPRAWGFQYELAVLRARAGGDPRAAARAAIALNPRGPRRGALSALIRARSANELRRLGSTMPLRS